MSSTASPSAVPAAPGRGMRKAGKILLIVGAIITVLALAAGIALTAFGAKSYDAADTDSTIFVGATTLDLEAGTTYQVYVHADAEDSTCTATAADGSTSEPGTPDGATFDDSYDDSWKSASAFTVPTDGSYEVACTPAENEVEVGTEPGSDSRSGALTALGGIAVLAIGTPLGVLLLIVGLVLVLVGRSRATAAQGPTSASD
ncbi:hypothetical protein [Brachybacterium sp. ACRRE]|uniref:hypothetical protein n=1 Tax=Brachybacterium sp. ACRRE TaxID=2918184 RepID=UPI001EF2D855|nr:hypothetical protein [Brachybacterium sp. ACRRE]MCG7308346.1 hypothetical protein [Brachybacterium sp. ACRRE]